MDKQKTFAKNRNCIVTRDSHIFVGDTTRVPVGVRLERAAVLICPGTRLNEMLADPQRVADVGWIPFRIELPFGNISYSIYVPDDWCAPSEPDPHQDSNPLKEENLMRELRLISANIRPDTPSQIAELQRRGYIQPTIDGSVWMTTLLGAKVLSDYFKRRGT